MRNVLSSLVVGLSLLTMSGCGTVSSPAVISPATDVTASDFVPPQGRAAGAKEFTAGVRRILTATSEDGIRFTPTGTVVSDRANVPDLLLDDDGTIRMYYIGQGIVPGKEESTVVAFSKDGGETWAYRFPTFVNFPNHRDPSDPDVVRLSDGSYRMYFTYSVSATKLGIAYAESPDGMTFTYEGGESFEGPLDAVDSNTVYYDGVWHMFTGQEQTPGQLHATSTDGYAFALASDRAPVFPGRDYYSSDELVVDDAIRLYAFSKTEGNARSFTSTDGMTWAQEDVALAADDTTTLGTGYLQDVAVVRLEDGTYFMAYVSGLPE